MAGVINFDRVKAGELKAALEVAQEEGVAQFVFEDHELLTGYAECMVEYLEQQFGGLDADGDEL